MADNQPPPLSGGDAARSVGDAARFGVLTVSDRASAGTYEDLSGPAILRELGAAVLSPWTADYRVIPDERELIERTLREMADGDGGDGGNGGNGTGCSVIFTTGGTGPAPRDVTPEATEAVCDRMMPGYGELMRTLGLKHVPTAVLSRQTAGLRGGCLIINFPGKPKSIGETFAEVFKSVPYCVQLAGGPYIETHAAVVDAFRPPNDRRAARPAAGAAEAGGGGGGKA
jgi:molybdopterin adenylyltransferase